MNLKQFTALIVRQHEELKAAMVAHNHPVEDSDLKLVLPKEFTKSIAWDELMWEGHAKTPEMVDDPQKELTAFNGLTVDWVDTDVLPRVTLKDEPSISLNDLLTGEFRPLSDTEIQVMLGNMGQVAMLPWMSNFLRTVESDHPGQFTTFQKDVTALQSVTTSIFNQSLLTARLVATIVARTGCPAPEQIKLATESRFHWGKRVPLLEQLHDILAETKADNATSYEWVLPRTWLTRDHHLGRQFRRELGVDPTDAAYSLSPANLLGIPVSLQQAPEEQDKPMLCLREEKPENKPELPAEQLPENTN